jgi:predicted ATP-grasp superfamily ATP-dependent carboligase
MSDFGKLGVAAYVVPIQVQRDVADGTVGSFRDVGKPSKTAAAYCTANGCTYGQLLQRLRDGQITAAELMAATE